MPAPNVTFRQVTYVVKGRTLLSDISLELAAGSTTALLGKSGSGKTTLMRMVNALVHPSAGEVLVAERSTQDWNALELRRSIGYVIQETGLFPHWTVARNAGLALELSGSIQHAARVEEVLRMTGLPPDLASRYPLQLSGGQRQRVGLARAMAADPGILLMDEPFGALDPITRSEQQTMLKKLLAEVKKTVLLVTHDLDEALFLADRVILLEEGSIVADMPASAVMTSQNKHIQAYIGAVHRSPIQTLTTEVRA